MPQSSKSKSYISATPEESWWGLFTKMRLGAQVSMIVSLILILAGALGLVFLQSTLLEESQDIRQQAAVEDGQIVITSQLRLLEGGDTTTQNVLTPGENNIDLYIDTKSLQTDTVRLVFEIWPTDQFGEASTISAIVETPDFEVNPELGLEIIDQEVEQNGAGYLMTATLQPIAPATTFSTPQATQFASIRFPYLTEEIISITLDNLTNGEGNEVIDLPDISLSFDNEESVVYRYGSTPPEDELQYVARNTFSGPDLNTIEDETEDTEDEEEIVDEEEEVLVVDNQEEDDEEETIVLNNQDDENEEEEEEKTTTTQEQVGKGGKTIKTVSCNETCASNHQCDAGLACYSGRCRNPLNLQSSSCSQANPATTATMAERCSQSCETHRDCPANMLCHASSQSCRLATNPGSLSCSPATAKTVSNLYDSGDTQTGSTGSTPGSTTSGQTNSATISGSVLEQIEAERAEKLAQEQQDAAAVGPVTNQNLGITLFGIFVPINMLLGGLIALGALICLLVILTMRGRSQNSESQFVTSKRVLTPEEHAAHQKATQEIKDKISALQKVEAHTKTEVATHVAQRPSGMMTPNSVIPPKPGMPTQTPVKPAVIQQQPPEPVSSPVVSQVPPVKRSSMLERIKQKNIATPVYSAKSSSENSQDPKPVENQQSTPPESPTQPTNNS